jgi:hypothetical protein
MSNEEKEILRSFYSQLEKSPITFSIFGFFNIDLSLLASVLTAIVSYQIILVQFHANSKDMN